MKYKIGQILTVKRDFNVEMAFSDEKGQFLKGRRSSLGRIASHII